MSHSPTLPHDVTDWRAWIDYGQRCAQHWGATTTPAPGRSEHTGRALRMTGYRETEPGGRWQRLFRATWPAYRAWYLAGSGQRPTLAEAEAALSRYLPELVPTWRRLVALADHDPVAARLLTMWRLPGFMSGCTQAVVPGAEPILARNYDYDPDLFEGVVASTNYSGERAVIGSSDLLWGLLDGMNEDGLTISLTWGGRPGQQDGFAIPLVIRYLLETCATVEQAAARLATIPIAQAYNLTLVDTTGAHASIFVAPGEEPVVSDLRAVANHRLDVVENPAAAGRIRSAERQAAAADLLRAPSVQATELGDGFLRDPLRTSDFSFGMGTLYTAIYEPARGRVTYRWPGREWVREFDSDADEVLAELIPA